MKIKKDLNAIFEEIDQNLIAKSIPIPHRFTEALGDLSIIFNTEIPISTKNKENDESLGYFLSSCLDNWYSAKYGDKRKLNIDIGFFYILIKNDLWRYRVPNFFGECNFFIERDLSDKGGKNETNILRMCNEMTQFYINSLNEEEVLKIFDLYKIALEVFPIFRSWSKLKFFQAINADLNNVSIQLKSDFPHYGQALFSYQQVGEKILKSWLIQAGLTQEELKRKYGHHIDKLVKKFNELYENNIEFSLLEGLKNDQNFRYSQEDDFSKAMIMEAQQALFYLILSIGDAPKLREL